MFTSVHLDGLNTSTNSEYGSPYLAPRHFLSSPNIIFISCLCGIHTRVCLCQGWVLQTHRIVGRIHDVSWSAVASGAGAQAALPGESAEGRRRQALGTNNTLTTTNL